MPAGLALLLPCLLRFPTIFTLSLPVPQYYFPRLHNQPHINTQWNVFCQDLMLYHTHPHLLPVSVAPSPSSSASSPLFNAHSPAPSFLLRASSSISATSIGAVSSPSSSTSPTASPSLLSSSSRVFVPKHHQQEPPPPLPPPSVGRRRSLLSRQSLGASCLFLPRGRRRHRRWRRRGWTGASSPFGKGPSFGATAAAAAAALQPPRPHPPTPQPPPSSSSYSGQHGLIEFFPLASPGVPPPRPTLRPSSPLPPTTPPPATTTAATTAATTATPRLPPSTAAIAAERERWWGCGRFWVWECWGRVGIESVGVVIGGRAPF